MSIKEIVELPNDKDTTTEITNTTERISKIKNLFDN